MSLTLAIQSVPEGYGNTKRVVNTIRGCLELIDSLRGMGSKEETVE